MRLLLDTHALVWAMADPARLSPRARLAVTSGATDAYASVVSAWELAILEGLGRVRLGAPLESLFSDGLAALRIRLLPIQVQHAARVASLPNHHRDPFDRLLIATAMTEKLTVVTRDRTFARYGVSTVW